jgi:hypothetical protein
MQTARFELLKRVPKIGMEAVADQTVPDFVLYTVFGRLIDSVYEAGGLKALEPVINAYVKSRPEQPDALIALGALQYQQAWTARGRDDEVTPEQRKAFNDGLAVVEKTLEQAWKLDPTDDRAATLMLSTKHSQGDGGGGREAVELWFKRAIEANPSNLDVCRRKLDYLRPDAYGSKEEMIAFGRECLKTSNWSAGIPFILVDAHQSLMMWSEKRAAYYADAETWNDVQAVYEGCLLNFPNDVAEQQIAILGNKAKWRFTRAGSTTRTTTTRPTTRPATQPPRQ